jgi:hypothetical protein
VLSILAVADAFDRYLQQIAARPLPGDAKGAVSPVRPLGAGAVVASDTGGNAPGQALPDSDLPGEVITGFLAFHERPDFWERVSRLVAKNPMPRLLRQLGWLLVREDPRRAPRIFEALLTRGDLSAPGAVSLLVDLAEEAPGAVVAHLPALLGRLRGASPAEPADLEHRLSDLLCLGEIPRDFLVREVAPSWERIGDARVRQILLRHLVHQRVLPLTRHRGRIFERVHGARPFQQAYSYHVFLAGEEVQIVDLTRDLQLNLSRVPKFVPSFHLRRYLQKPVDLEGTVDRIGEGPPRYLLQSIQEADV